MSNPFFVIVSGYYNSGSSAAIDLLKEYDCTYENGSEMRLISDPYGILSLERALTDDWHWIRSSMAIDDFLCYVKKCARKKSHFPLAAFGMGYKETINPQIVELAHEYINKISEYSYAADLYAYKAKKNYLEYTYDRCVEGIYTATGKRIDLRREHIIHFANPTKERFFKATKEFYDQLYGNHYNLGKEYVILDQAITPCDWRKIKCYFTKAKMIIVDRDIRDTFAQSIITKEFDYQNTKEQGDNFIKLQRSMRKNIEENDSVMIIKFEELILNKDQTQKNIEDFLGLDHRHYLYPSRFLQVEKSQKNIGIWEKVYNQYNQAIDEICNYRNEGVFSYFER